MIQALIGPIANLAGTWFQNKVEKTKADGLAKVAEAKARATVAEKVAAGGDLKIYPSRTVDSKKNPIDPDMKVSYMRKMFPDFEEQIQNDAEMRSIFNVLTTAAEEGYTGINIVVGADRLGEFESLATKYNGDLYNFKEIKTVSAGPRDDDAEGV